MVARGMERDRFSRGVVVPAYVLLQEKTIVQDEGSCSGLVIHEFISFY